VIGTPSRNRRLGEYRTPHRRLALQTDASTTPDVGIDASYQQARSSVVPDHAQFQDPAVGRRARCDANSLEG
jgi:hypothetical protein